MCLKDGIIGRRRFAPHDAASEIQLRAATASTQPQHATCLTGTQRNRKRDCRGTGLRRRVPVSKDSLASWEIKRIGRHRYLHLGQSDEIDDEGSKVRADFKQ